ncbi:MAG: GNAT family N-acetyltransferase [Candidatus Omnitrophica bacterium]|nr:GNAT family N-acetyltransferase [Candidatus Omnitrophota bacterium]
MNEVSIVPVEDTASIKEVASLAREIWREHYIAIIGEPQVEYMLGRFQSDRAIAAQIEEGYIYYLMKLHGMPVGYLSIKPQEETKEIFLSKLYIKADHRRKGYGRIAIRFIEDSAKKRNLHSIALTVNKHNTDAISAYQRFGFKNRGPTVRDIGNGFIMDDYKMSKDLGAGECQ